jgi:putative ABC transport system permease protein
MLDRWKTLSRNLTRKQKVESDLDAELRSYRDMLEEEKLRAGVAPEAARREALLEIGGIEQVKEQVRDVRMGVRLETIATELRHSFRGLRRNPGMSLLVVGILALGMGATTAVFSVFQSALLKPLPFRDAGRLVELTETRMQRGVERADFSEANFWDVRARNRSFEDVAAYRYDEANLTGNGPAEKVTFILVSAGFFRTLGVDPVAGRIFSSDDHDVVMLGHRFWKSRFGADPAIAGKTLRLNDRSYTIAGVLPPGEPWIDDQIYAPFPNRPDADRSSWEFQVIARLRPGISAESARADLQTVAAGLDRDFPKDDQGIGFGIDPSSTWVAPDTTRRALWVLLGAVTFLLLIACTNIANLLLARGLARRREIAVRIALGAGRARLVRFILMESFLLSAFGAMLGLLVAWGAVRALQTLEIRDIPRLMDASLNPWVLAFAAATAILTGLLAGLAPAAQAPARGIGDALREGDRQTGSRAQGFLRAALITAEVALSFLLLAGAGLLIRSFTQLLNVNSGFETANRLVFSVSLPGSYWQNGAGKQFLDRFFDRLSADPSVIAAGAISQRPIEGGNPGMNIGASATTEQRPPWAGWRVISPGYFRAAGLPLVSGRIFDENDKPVWTPPGQPDPQRHVILSEHLARRIFPGQNPIGRHVLLWKTQSNRDAEVVGVAADSRERGPSAGPTNTVYLPYGANALPGEFIVHTRTHPMRFASEVRQMVASLDPNLPVADVRSFEDVVGRSIAPQRLNALLLAVFSGLALILAASGIYGVISYSMRRRTAEIGLRMALGASPGNLLRTAIGQGIRPVLLGIALGAMGALWLSHYLVALLFNVTPFDAITYAAVAAILLATSILACYFPCRLALRIDPLTALRTE